MEIPVDLRHLEPEITLGRSIIDRAVLDSATDQEALDWFSLEDEDFILICQLAMLKPKEVIEKQKIVLEKLLRKATLGTL